MFFVLEHQEVFNVLVICNLTAFCSSDSKYLQSVLVDPCSPVAPEHLSHPVCKRYLHLFLKPHAPVANKKIDVCELS